MLALSDVDAKQLGHAELLSSLKTEAGNIRLQGPAGHDGPDPIRSL
jgi:hypothetical protein